MMFDEKTQHVARVLNVIDIGITVAVFVFTYWARTAFFPDSDADLFSHLALLPLILALLLFFLPYFGAYNSPRTTSVFGYAWGILRAVGFSIAALLSLLFLLKVAYVSRSVILAFAVIETVALTAWRATALAYFRSAYQRGENYLKVLIIGTGDRAISLSKAIRQRSDWGIDIVGHLDPDPSKVGATILDAPVIGTVANISEVLRDHVIDEVILAIPRTMLEDVEDIAYACQEEGIKFRLMADMFNLRVSRMRLVELGAIPLLTLEPVARDEARLLVKRFMDFSFTVASMPVLLPLFGIIAIAIKLDSKGPVFFTQPRVGRDKRVFKMYKFRSMVEGSEKMIKDLEAMNEAEGPIFKIANDPRVTRVGRFLRKTSLDELPQLINVIKGEMSLVGPRPMSLRDVNLFDKGIQRKRFSVKPGLTCIWQISGRSNLPFTKWLELDLFYIENWSLGLDLKILLKTIPAVLRGSGAV